jgi:hypothetical protein
MRSILLTAFLITFLEVAPARAEDTLRCGSHLIKTGDHKVEVLQKCGEPLYRETVSALDERRIEKWTYRPSGNTFMRLLTFTESTLTDIEILTNP